MEFFKNALRILTGKTTELTFYSVTEISGQTRKSLPSQLFYGSILLFYGSFVLCVSFEFGFIFSLFEFARKVRNEGNQNERKRNTKSSSGM